MATVELIAEWFSTIEQIKNEMYAFCNANEDAGEGINYDVLSAAGELSAALAWIGWAGANR